MGLLLSWRTVSILWMAWVIYWAISAQNVRKTETKEPLPWRIGTPLLTALAAMLIFSPIFSRGELGKRFVPVSQSVERGGLALIVAGTVISVWARRHLGQFWSSAVALKVEHQLIQSGPYAWVRHPIYSGLLLALTGTALFVGEWRAVVGLAIVLIVFWFKAHSEEGLLLRHFGVIYEQYCGRTGTLLPKLF